MPSPWLESSLLVGRGYEAVSDRYGSTGGPVHLHVCVSELDPKRERPGAGRERKGRARAAESGAPYLHHAITGPHTRTIHGWRLTIHVALAYFFSFFIIFFLRGRIY